MQTVRPPTQRNETLRRVNSPSITGDGNEIFKERKNQGSNPVCSLDACNSNAKLRKG